MKNIYKVLIGLVIFIIIMINPITREILWFLVIPSGWDDLFVYGAGAAFGIFVIVGLINGTISLSIKDLWNKLKE